MAKWKLLKAVHLFNGLDESELNHLAAICQKQDAAGGTIIVEQNTTGSKIYIVGQGTVEVFIQGFGDERVLVVLGEGQVFGEMALIDQGYRSASVRATKEGCTLYSFEQDAFVKLVKSNLNIGFVVMRNLASDLAFKLRHRNLAQM